MTDITSEARFKNFFVLFEQPVTFELLQKNLDTQLRTLQKQYHPDNVIEDSENKAEALRLSEQASAFINQGYQTLSRLDSRAAYLLDLRGQAQTLEHSIADLDFLDDAMTMRMDLDDAINANSQAELQRLYPLITERLQMQSKHFVQAYDTQDWQSAIDATQKLKFLVKLEADIFIAVDDVANTVQTDDDDLYV